MLPGVVLSGILSPLSGKWCDKYNPRLFLVLGFLITSGSTYWFSWLGMQTEERTLVWALIVRAGLGLVFAPIAMLGLRTLAREEISAASGLLNITRQIAGMGGIALAGVLLERWQYVHHLTGSAHLAAATDAVAQVEGQLAWSLRAGGEVGDLMQTTIEAVLSNYLAQESLSIAFQDCFMVFTAVFAAAALASLCIPGGERKKASGEPSR
jgi:MFS family permease